MNTILALLIFVSLSYYQGTPQIRNEPVIAEVYENKPAYNIGILPGDRIVEINGQGINSWDELSSIIHSNPNTEISLLINRQDSLLDYNIITSTQIIPFDSKLDTVGVIGITPEILYTNITLQNAFLLGAERTLSSFMMIVESLRMLGSGAASVKDFGGPIMIAQLAGQTAEAGMIPFLTFMALLSVNLAFLNILPIPGLDGGHIFIHLIEAVIRKPLGLKTRIVIQQIGMMFLLMLMVTIIFQDILRLFN